MFTGSTVWIAIVLFLVGFLLLIKGGDWFVDGSVGIARRFKVSELLIGATVVSIGTTIPEVMVSAFGAAAGSSGIAYGNAVGSIICNTSLIAALTVAIKPGKADSGALKLPVCVFFIAAAFYCAIAYLNGRFDRWVGIVLLAGFVCYILLSVRRAMTAPKADDAAEEEAEEKPWPLWKQLTALIGGAAVIALGARLLVDNGTFLAEKLGIPDSVIGLTVVALGTSLPELVTAVTSLIKGHSALSLGNVIGANLFNLVLVSGIATTIKPFDIPAEKMIGSVNASFAIDLPLMLIVMALLTLPAIKKQRLDRWQGITLLCVYAGYVLFQFI